jgi:hypothetical protein
VAIYLHHEMAQTPIYPSRLFFFCEQPATEGGATPICRSDVLWERLAALRPEHRPALDELEASLAADAADDDAWGPEAWRRVDATLVELGH